MRFAGVDLLMQATRVTAAGSQPTSASARVADVYERAEPVIIRIASAVAGTVAKLAQEPVKPQGVELNFGLSVSIEGDIVLLKGTTEATMAITLSYAAVGLCSGISWPGIEGRWYTCWHVLSGQAAYYCNCMACTG
jgi:hypothetical protein